MAYDTPNHTIRREYSATTIAGATTESLTSKFRSFQKIRLKKAHAVAIVAGTATTHGFTIKVGTTSVGAISLGTSAAGSVASSALLDVVVPSMTQISATSLADATGVSGIVYEYEVLPDAVQS